MKLDKPIVFLDVESTGLDPCVDRILELAMLAWDGEQITSNSVARFHPSFPIPAESTAVHGITDADVVDCPLFDAVVARRVLARLKGCDIAGYNLRMLDLPLLDEELRRASTTRDDGRAITLEIYKLNLDGVRIIDVSGIFKKKEPRTLADAVRKYCGRELTDAHGAKADNEATLEVLLGQMAMYPDVAAMSVDEMATFSRIGEGTAVDAAGKLHRDADGFLCFSFGQHRGERIHDNIGFAMWMLRKDFPASTREALEVELARTEV